MKATHTPLSVPAAACCALAACMTKCIPPCYCAARHNIVTVCESRLRSDASRAPPRLSDLARKPTRAHRTPARLPLDTNDRRKRQNRRALPTAARVSAAAARLPPSCRRCHRLHPIGATALFQRPMLHASSLRRVHHSPASFSRFPQAGFRSRWPPKWRGAARPWASTTGRRGPWCWASRRLPALGSRRWTGGWPRAWPGGPSGPLLAGRQLCAPPWPWPWPAHGQPALAASPCIPRRLLAVLPVVAANICAPRLFCRGTDAVAVILVAFNTAWLSSFKVSCAGSRVAGALWHSRAPAGSATPCTPTAPAAAGAGVGDGPRRAGRRPADRPSVYRNVHGAPDPPAWCAPRSLGGGAACAPSPLVASSCIGRSAHHHSRRLCRLLRADPPAGHKKGRLAEDAGGVVSHAVNYAAKLAVVGAAMALLISFPHMPSVLYSFFLSECRRWWVL